MMPRSSGKSMPACSSGRCAVPWPLQVGGVDAVRLVGVRMPSVADRRPVVRMLKVELRIRAHRSRATPGSLTLLSALKPGGAVKLIVARVLTPRVADNASPAFKG